MTNRLHNEAPGPTSVHLPVYHNVKNVPVIELTV